MKPSFTSLLIAGVCAAACQLTATAADPAPAEISAALKRSADWQLASPTGMTTTSWIIAPFYDGLLRTALTTGDPKYLAAVIRFGNQSGWTPGKRVYHADDHAVGHAWLDVYLMDPSEKKRLAPMRDRLSHIIKNPVTELLAHGKTPATKGVEVGDRWSWCDALYMAPPTLTRLHAATGDAKYLDFLEKEYRQTHQDLYDPEEHLFFRDAKFIDKKTPAGKKTFWSRGNGWVYGGLALLLEHLPADHSSRGFYETLFKEMTSAILAAQQPDGLWTPSLLDPAQVPTGETSGSGFFVFGLAWGVNHGLLDRATHWPAITRGWAGLVSRTRPDGFVGYVQPVGAAPGGFGPDSVKEYGTGAFLLAGAEVLRSLGAESKTTPAALYAAANEILAAEAKTPRAYARLVPERRNDLAWENDKVAFRAYGPGGPEDSGIDVWCKRVPYPILDKWYDQALTKKLGYHKDHGEGLDAYHVGKTRGCGGIGLWIDGKLVTGGVYQSADIAWTAPDIAQFRTIYQYPVKLRGKPLYETRVTRLRLGERLFEVISYFSHRVDRNPKPISDFPYEIAIGLVTHHPAADFSFSPETGIMAVSEPLKDQTLFTAVVIDPTTVLRMEKLPVTDRKKTFPHAVTFTKPDKTGKFTYRAGFAWSAAGEITTPVQWTQYLESQAAAGE